ncbi:Cytochrome P450 2S1 [Manis javanica]|nr:Cytochrome P450 2S1 [Manis javanica]
MVVLYSYETVPQGANSGGQVPEDQRGGAMVEDFKTFLGLRAENLKQVDTFWVQDEWPLPHSAEVPSHLLCDQEEGDPHTEFNQENLLISTLNIFFAKIETTSTTLRYGLLILLKRPPVTERVQEELTRELGPGRAPGLGDQARLPYTDAVLHEAQRLLALVPMGMPHTLTKTTCFRGYTLPQGTEVFPLLGSVLHDPKIFEQPEEFNPGRFLAADGRFQKQEAFLPFSLGKRVCLGEGLARAELFLLFTTILQAFSLESPCPPAALSLQPAVSGLFNIPPAFQLQVRPR